MARPHRMTADEQRAKNREDIVAAFPSYTAENRARVFAMVRLKGSLTVQPPADKPRLLAEWRHWRRLFDDLESIAALEGVEV